jgi:dolichyl-phosphate-mannose--protein O-mannosyl transferase
MSRTGMADTAIAFFTTASLACFYNYLKQKKLIHYSLLLTGIFTGLNLATKWSGSLTYLIYAVFLLARLIKYLKQPKAILFVIYCLVFVPLAIYFLMFLPFFTSGHTLTQWWELQRQMYYYHSHLKATHAYQSMAWQWPLLLRPVWFYVDYAKTAVANIYNLGNPAIFWGGLISLLFCRNLFLLASYLLLFFPLVFSPRIMFLHHYLPALAILCLILANVVSRLPKKYITFIIVITVITFIFFYPINSAVPLPSNLVKYWFWLPGWR